MGSIEQYTYWSMTLNNPDENDWVLVRNPNEKYVRQLIHTREVGEQGTEHIQAWVRLQRNQTRAFMKRLWPKAHFNPIKKDEYNENCIAYAQKNDDTTGGHHINTINDPLPANDTLLYKVLDESFIQLCKHDELVQDHYDHDSYHIFLNGNLILNLKKLDTKSVERRMVSERQGLEKIFCSPAYDKMKEKFWREILYRIYKQKDDEYHSQQERKEDDEGELGSGSESEDNEDGCSETDEGSNEGSGSETDETDD